VYEQHKPEEVGWFQSEPEPSLTLIEEAGLAAGAPIVDVGGGASRLAGALLRAGHTDVTVADLSANALQAARRELGDRADEITWVDADVRSHDFGRRFQLWHDRATLHFMVDAADRDAYVETMRRSLAPGGHLILATFGPDGPTRCSGLPVHRYGAAELQGLLGDDFELVFERLRDHTMPSGAVQQFQHAHLRRSQASGGAAPASAAGSMGSPA
jgi:ubiquinone/menaquinone biosynthesis C-methylase UbiE